VSAANNICHTAIENLSSYIQLELNFILIKHMLKKIVCSDYWNNTVQETLLFYSIFHILEVHGMGI
jgi:hypothetical protein